MLVYYVARVADVIAQRPALPSGVLTRPLTRGDIPALAKEYLEAYDPPVVATLQAASAEMTSAFDGAWGELWPQACVGAWRDDDLLCVAQTVRRPAWDAAPDLPWLIELFTAPAYRRSGLARGLLAAVGDALADAGEPQLGLTVDTDNRPAVDLYVSLGFGPMAP